MDGHMSGAFSGWIECEQFGEEFGLGNGDGSVGVVGEVEAEEAGCTPVESHFVVLADVCW
jgi:hypothetical protein